MIERVVQLMILILSIISFLQSDPFWGIMCIISLLIVYIPGIIQRELKITLSLELEILMFGALLLHLLGGVLNLYTAYNWDFLTHLVSSILTAVIGFISIVIIDRYVNSVKLNSFLIILFVILFTLAVGVLWELGEFFSDYFFGTEEQHGYLDTMSDLLIDLLGGIIMAVVSPLYLRGYPKRIEERLLDGMGIDEEKIGRISLKAKKNKKIKRWEIIVPALIAVFIIYFLYTRTYLFFIFSLALFLFTHMVPITKRSSISIEIELLFFVVLSLRFFGDLFNIETYSVIMPVFAFMFVFIMGKHSNSIKFNGWFTSFFVVILALAFMSIFELLRFLFLLSSYTNLDLMLNFARSLIAAVLVSISGTIYLRYISVYRS